MSNGDVGLENLSGGLVGQELDKVVLDSGGIGPGVVGLGGEQDPGLGVTSRDLRRVLGLEGIVPETKECLDFFLRNGLWQGWFRQHGRVVVKDHPGSVFLGFVEVRIASLDHVTGGAKGELVDSDVGGPVVSDLDVTFHDSSSGLVLEEQVEVVLYTSKVGADIVLEGGKEGSALAIHVGDGGRVQRRECLVPETEPGSDLVFCGLGLEDTSILGLAVVR